MTAFLAVLLFLAAMAGHAGLWIYIVNWIHSTPLEHKLAKAITVVLRAVLVGIPLLAGWMLLANWPSLDRMLFTETWPDFVPFPQARGYLLAYAAVCLLIAFGPVAVGAWRRLTFRPPEQLVANHARTESFSHAEHAGPGIGGAIVRLPGNESLELTVAEKQLRLPRLDARLRGMRIAHLSDLHFTGRIRKAFFERIIRITQAASPDLIAISGDLVDRDECIEWIPELFSQLSAPLGVFAVLGNHDIRVNVSRLRRAVQESGVELIGDRWTRLQFREAPLVIAGNELPWFPPVANLNNCPDEMNGARPLRILISHSPDQISWARRRGFDLMLAGHTHGGQIRLPLWGPIVAPSRHGTRYASGTFYERPTLMHVSRGVSAKLPLRWNCPPELAFLELIGEDASAIEH